MTIVDDSLSFPGAPKFLNPHFNEITVESGHDAVEEFPVRTHTNEFSHCVITSDTHHNAGFMERVQKVVRCT
ncbi:hypothetical protein BaRGS_00024586, partial [Batillaria attramentaria]